MIVQASWSSVYANLNIESSLKSQPEWYERLSLGWIYVFYAAIIRWDATDVRRINAADNQNLRISWDWKSDRVKTDVYARTTWVDRWKPYHKPKYQTNYIAVALYVNVMFCTKYIIHN